MRIAKISIGANGNSREAHDQRPEPFAFGKLSRRSNFLFSCSFKKDAEIIAVHPGKFTASKKLLQRQTIDRTLYAEFRSGIRDILDLAGPAPSAVDSHHVSVVPSLEHDPP
jgi:hypothetical protein